MSCIWYDVLNWHLDRLVMHSVMNICRPIWTYSLVFHFLPCELITVH